jgi:hypothetical protein
MKEKPSPYFHHLINHISKKWREKKGFGYPFQGRNFRDLKNATSSFMEWQLMSLYDVFIENESDWVRESGYSVGAFLACLPWLVDDKNWKMRAREYENKIAPLPKEIGDILKK